jgi:ferrous-iron efflux pump FieF
MTAEQSAHQARLSPVESGKWKTIAAVAAVGVAIVLILIKAVAWILSGSVAMLASLFDSSLDLVASALNLFAIRQAIAPADAEHRFGHGKAEPIAGLAQGAIILGSATFLVIESVDRLLTLTPISNAGLGIAVMIASIALTGGLVLLQRRVVKTTGSLAISADQLHYAGDLLMNAMVIAAIVAAGLFGWTYADGIGGLIVAAIIAYGAVKIMLGSFDNLMDREFADDDRARIKAIVVEHPDVRAIHDLRTRSSGSASFIQFHIELEPSISLMRAHAISDDVESRVRRSFPDADVIIHQDPAGVEDPPTFVRRNNGVRAKGAAS